MSRPRGSAASPWWFLGLILVAAVAIDLPALRTDFFADDYLFLDQVRDRSLVTALAAPDPLGNFFRPVSRQLYFWLVSGVAGESALAFHLVNLALFLVCLALLFSVARRLAGARTGLIASGLLALHYAPDVALRWACGSQDLLAVLGALAALRLHLARRHGWAGLAMLMAALSKEIVLLTPVIAVIAGREPGESWRSAIRRAWPLGAGALAWGVAWLVLPHRHAEQAAEIAFDPVGGPLGAFAHLFQVLVGAEWLRGRPARIPLAWPPLLPLLAVLAAIASAWWLRSGDTRRSEVNGTRGHAVRVGGLWALAATVPIMGAASLWSAYYYVFALCGAFLALGALLPALGGVPTLVVVALLAAGSSNARELGEFAVARGPWTSCSHINRSYIERSNRLARGYLGSLRRRHPTLPSGSTLFFNGIQGGVAFQRANGPLLRWAYNDTSLRSYYLSAFNSDLLRRGPVYFFQASGETLKDLGSGPHLYLRLGFGLLLSEQPRAARDALAIAQRGEVPRAAYWRTWAEWGSGDSAAARRSLQALGARMDGAATFEHATALAAVARGDTLAAIEIARGAIQRHALDPEAHGLLADLSLMRNPAKSEGVIEAYAARVLAPGDPWAWRRWGAVQAGRGRLLEALASFDRYRELGGAGAQSDAEVSRWAASLRRRIGGGTQVADAPRP